MQYSCGRRATKTATMESLFGRPDNAPSGTREGIFFAGQLEKARVGVESDDEMAPKSHSLSPQCALHKLETGRTKEVPRT